MAQTMTQTCARCGVAAPVGARYCPSCGAALGDAPREERRLVTVLFGDLSGFTELAERRDAEEVKGIIDLAFAAMSEIISAHGGRIDKVIGDEIMAVFGAPVAHEDDAERAVRAALAMQRRLREFSVELESERGIALQMHIGVNTGEVVAGFIGGSDSYTVIGDVVNTARRIEDAAEADQILVGEATHDASRTAIEYRRVGHVTAKGKRLPVAVWEALAERGLPGARPRLGAPLIGREEELQVLGGLVDLVRRDRRPMLVTIIGEAGMGKSRVAAEFARRVPARVLTGRSLAYGTSSPAFAIEELVRAALLVAPGAGDVEARGWVRDRLRDLGLAQDADAVLQFLGLGAGPLRESGATGPAAAAAASRSAPVIDAAVKVLERVAEREGGLVLAFHELHWAEDEVLDGIEASMRRSRAPVLVLCLARPDLLERRPQWGSGPASTTIPLEPMSRDRAGELLDALAPALPPAIREGILDRAGGNPFYIEELARLLADRDARGGVEPDAIPASVQALVAARLDLLPAAEKRLLQDAAVVGERFWPGLLGRLEPAHEASMPVHLDALVEHGFIEPSEEATPVPGQAAFRFRQTLVREVAYGSVPKHVRAEQHAEVGRWLEDVTCACGKEREFYDLIAYHFEAAALLARDVGGSAPQAQEKAREYLARAGEAALERDSALTAAELFKRALAFTPAGADLDVRLRLAEALVATSRFVEAEEHLRRVLVGVRAAGDRAAEAKALRLLGDSFRMRGDMPRARENIQRALDIAKEAGAEREEAEGLRSNGLLDLMQGRWSSSTLWFRQALARYRELEDARGEGWSLQNLGWASMLMGRLDDALQYLNDGEAVFDAMGDQEGAGWCIGMRGWVHLMRGELGLARDVADHLERRLTIDHPEYAASAGFVLELQRILRAYVLVLLGRFADAEAVARDAVEKGEFLSQHWAQALGRGPIAFTAILSRRFADARDAIDAGEREALRFGDPFYVGLFRFARAWLAFEEGDLDGAEKGLRTFLGEGELGATWQHSSSGRWLMAQVARERGTPNEAREVLSRVGQQNIGLISAARSRALLARLHIDAGDLDAAVTEARAAADQAGDEVVARAVAQRVLAEAHLAAGHAEAAEAAVRAALATLDGSDWDVERVRGLILLARVLDAQRRHDEGSEAFDRARDLIASLPAGTDTAPLETLLLA